MKGILISSSIVASSLKCSTNSCRYELASTKNRFERLLLCVGEQVAVPTSHFFSGVTNPFVDDSLVNPLGGTVAAKGVSKSVPTSKIFESATFEAGSKVIIGLVNSDF